MEIKSEYCTDIEQFLLHMMKQKNSFKSNTDIEYWNNK